MNNIFFSLHGSTLQSDISSIRQHQDMMIQLFICKSHARILEHSVICTSVFSLIVQNAPCIVPPPQFLGCVSQLYHEECWTANYSMKMSTNGKRKKEPVVLEKYWRLNEMSSWKWIDPSLWGHLSPLVCFISHLIYPYFPELIESAIVERKLRWNKQCKIFHSSQVYP